jgi:hemerythrin
MMQFVNTAMPMSCALCSQAAATTTAILARGSQLSWLDRSSGHGQTETLPLLNKDFIMIGEDYFDVLVQQVRTEHRELHQRVKQVRDQLKALRGPLMSAADPADLRRALSELREYVTHHFCQEENGGCLEEAVVRMPKLAHELTLLEKQHQSLRADIDRLVDEVPTGESTGAAWKQTADDFEQFVRDLFTHEAGEEKLFQVGLNQEVGL